jgi:DNA polymerase I-like protein with 3'-5' exonuclease and polymerase domains
VDKELTAQKIDAYIMGWIHDEVQIACRTEEVANHVGDITRRMAEETGRAFNIQLPIEAEFSVGATWSDTH